MLSRYTQRITHIGLLFNHVISTMQRAHPGMDKNFAHRRRQRNPVQLPGRNPVALPMAFQDGRIDFNLQFEMRETVADAAFEFFPFAGVRRAA